MKTNVNFNAFCDAFGESYKNNFSYKGQRALFDYLEQYEEDVGEEIELDIVALCCEYTEYEDVEEYLENYNGTTLSEFVEEQDEELLKEYKKYEKDSISDGLNLAEDLKTWLCVIKDEKALYETYEESIIEEIQNHTTLINIEGNYGFIIISY